MGVYLYLKFTLGVLLLPLDSIQEVYDGIWGYSAILSTCALTCVFFAFNQMSLLLGLVNLLGTIGVQYGLRTTLFIQVFFLLKNNYLLTYIHTRVGSRGPVRGKNHVKPRPVPEDSG